MIQASHPLDATRVAAGHHGVLVENDRLRVWKSELHIIDVELDVD